MARRAQTVEVPELTSSGLLLVRIFFQEIIAAGDDAAFMEVRFRFREASPNGPPLFTLQQRDDACLQRVMMFAYRGSSNRSPSPNCGESHLPDS